MAKFIIQPNGTLKDRVADEKGYFTEERLDYELNVEGSRKNTPRLAAVDANLNVCRCDLSRRSLVNLSVL